MRRTQKRSGLAKVVERLNYQKEHLVRLRSEITTSRRNTAEALAVGTQCGLLRVIYEEGRVRAVDANTPRLPASLDELDKTAEKLGAWFGRLDLSVVSSLLNVRL